MIPNNQESIIRVSHFVNTVVDSRDVVQRLAHPIRQTTSRRIMLDFSGIEFVSRSAAHELLSLKRSLRSWNPFTSKQLEFQNLNPTIAQLLRIVAHDLSRQRPVQTRDIKETTPEQMFQREIA